MQEQSAERRQSTGFVSMPQTTGRGSRDDIVRDARERIDGKPAGRGIASAPGLASMRLHVRPAELRSAPPAHRDDDQFVAQLSSPGLSTASYVVGRHDGHAPEWIVLDYAEERHQRVWRRTRARREGSHAYILVEDDSSTGYVSAPRVQES